MKILFVCTVPTEKSGIPNVIFNLIGTMGKNDVELGYVAINNPSSFFIEKLRGHHVGAYVITRKLSNPIGYIKNLSQVAQDYDIIHVHGNSATMTLEMIAAKLAGVKIRIAHSHNTTCRMKIIDRLCRPIFYKLCNGRMACGIEAGKWLFNDNDFMVLNNGIDSQRFKFSIKDRDSVRNNLGIEKNEILIGHIGNFVEQKNHDFLIDIFYNYNKQNPHSKLLLLGDGVLREKINNKIQNLGITDKVIFTGSVDNPAFYMNGIDLIVMPSLFEGLPLTLIEEQANGLPILAANTITKDANITNKIEFLDLSDKPIKWAEKMEEILVRSNHDSETSMKAIEKIKAAKYDIFSVAEELIDYYKSRLSDK